MVDANQSRSSIKDSNNKYSVSNVTLTFYNLRNMQQGITPKVWIPTIVKRRGSYNNACIKSVHAIEKKIDIILKGELFKYIGG